MTPTTGMLAEGYAGKGRMVEPAEILTAVTTFLTAPTPLANRHLLVTAGGTREPLDPVRYLGNRSSGKMGVAIVKAALAAGAKVTLIAGSVQVALPTHPRLTVQRVTTTAEMLAAAQAVFPTVDAVVMAAAVADFRPVTVSDQKIKKQAGQEAFTVQLVKNPDILATLGAKKTTQVIMGFAAETNDLLAHAKEKLAKKHVDYIVANDVSQAGSGFGVATDQVTILTPDQAPQAWPLLTKQEVGHRLVALLASRLAK